MSKQSIRPRRIILVRHAESEGNVDEKAYQDTPDWKIPLSKKGEAQSEELGKKLRELVGNSYMYVYCSPYRRAKQTLFHALSAFKPNKNQIGGIREDPRLSEQQFGNFQTEDMITSKQERNRFGRFFYRFPQGESGLDVYTRTSSFLGSLFREFNNREKHHEDMNIVIVTHGLALRLLLMRWFKLTVEEFEASMNPDNASFVTMERQDEKDGDGNVHYCLSEEDKKLLNIVYNRDEWASFLH